MSEPIFVYHAIPSGMLGNTLYPLSGLKSQFPELYEIEVQKYDWRKSVLNITVPKLNCLWGDVIHFSAVDPRFIYQKLLEAGHNYSPNRGFYRIPLERLKSKRSVLFQSKRILKSSSSHSSDNQFDDFTVHDSEVELLSNLHIDPLLQNIPDETIDYYHFEKAHARRPLVFYGICHVLFEGSLDVSGLDRIVWGS